jgi:hypothetical protein
MSIDIADLPTLNPSEYDPYSDLILVQKEDGATYSTTSEALFRFQNARQSNLINFFQSPPVIDEIVDSHKGTTKVYNMNSFNVPSSAKSVLLHLNEILENGASYELFIFHVETGDDKLLFRRLYNAATHRSKGQPATYTDQLWVPIRSDGNIRIHYDDVTNTSVTAKIIAYS